MSTVETADSAASTAGTAESLPLASARESVAVLWPLLRERRGYLLLVCAAGLRGSVAGRVAPWAVGLDEPRQR